jgi:hemerythrin-like domain-containing protein
MTDANQREDLHPFAFLRLTHEALRVASSGHVEAASADALPDVDAVRAMCADVEATLSQLHLHARQEDNGLYPLLDEHFDDVAKDEGYRAEHERLHEDEEALLRSVRALAESPSEAGWRSVADAVRAWGEATEKHLQHEENVLQPFTGKLTKADRAAAARHVNAIIDSADRERTEAEQVGWVARHLHAGRPFEKLQKYVLALQYSSTPAQFDRIKMTMRAALPEESWSQLEDAGVLDEGRLPD